VFTARYALSPHIKHIRFVFKGLIFWIHCGQLCWNIAHRNRKKSLYLSSLSESAVLGMVLMEGFVSPTFVQRIHFHADPTLAASLSGCVRPTCGSTIASCSRTWNQLKVYLFAHVDKISCGSASWAAHKISHLFFVNAKYSLTEGVYWWSLYREDIIEEVSQKSVSRCFISFEINSTSTGEQIFNRFFVREGGANTACFLREIFGHHWNAFENLPTKIFVASVRFCNWFCEAVCSVESQSLPDYFADEIT
jgi:hypothetical protein